MAFTIFLKQSFRSLKKNFSIVVLVFLFLVVGVSLIVGLSAYLFNAHQLTVGVAFKNGSQDGEIDAKNLAWNRENSSTDRDIIFTNVQKEKFKEIVKKPDGLDLNDQEEEFYSFLINNNGYTQSFLYKPNSFRDGNEQKFKDWIETNFKWFNGNALAYYFKQIIKGVNDNWDIRTTNIVGNNEVYYMSDDGSLKTYLPDERTVVLTTFDERWIDYDYQQGTLPPESLFSPGDFTYNLKIDYEKYKEIQASEDLTPLFLIEKNFRDFNLKVGDVIDVSNTLLPANAKSEKFMIVGDFVNAGRLINFSNKITGAIPFTHFWETIQFQNSYLEFPFYVTTNRNNAKNFFKRAEEIQKQIEASKLFEARAGPNESLPLLIPAPAGQYYAVVTFWQVNFPIVMLCIMGIALLLFFVILFTTNQLIENNKAALQFLKSMGLNNFELSSINMTLILLPMVLGFLIAIPGFFVIQNLFSFILEIQYPMILNFWMWNYETIFIFLGTVIFAFIVFFFTNLSVLRRHNILEKKEPKLIKRIKSGKTRNYIYNRIQPKIKIGLAIWAANLRKNLVTFGTLLVTFSVILFGVGFKGSIGHEAKLVETTFLPFKNFSTTSAFLFSEESLEIYSQETIKEEDLINPDHKWEITTDIDEEELKEIFTNSLKNHYFTSQTIDEIVERFGGFDEFLKYLENILKEIPQIPENSIPEILKIVEQLYANYQIIKLQLEKVYQYHDNNLKFVFGRSVNPSVNGAIKNVGKTLNLNVKINQKINKRVPPKKIHSLGLIDQNLKNIFVLNSRSNKEVEVKISQALATKLDIFKTDLKFKNPTFKFNVAFANNEQAISIPARVREIIQADFAQDAIYYSFDNLKSYLQTVRPPNEKIAEQIEKLLTDDSETAIPNGYFTDGAIPNSLLNLTIPIMKNDGNNIINYIPDENSQTAELQLLDFKIIGENLITETASYIDLVNRVIYIFIAITMIVALLLTYLFLVENKQNILLFKSLGYSVREIARFLLVGYIVAAIVAAGFAIWISVLAISLLSNVFVELFNAIIPFAFTPFYSFLFVLLPVLFVLLIFISLWIYIFIQDPKRALDI